MRNEHLDSTCFLHRDGLPLLNCTPKQRDTGEIVCGYLLLVFAEGKTPLGEKFHLTCQLSYWDCQLKLSTQFFFLIKNG